MKRYVLYGSADCCLCDNAAEVIDVCKKQFDLEVEKKDIYTDKGLLIKYRYTIPVLRDTEGERELAWPFDSDMLCRWLAQGGS